MGATRSGNCAWLSVGMVIGAVLMLAGVAVYHAHPLFPDDTPVTEVPAAGETMGTRHVPSNMLVEEAKPATPLTAKFQKDQHLKEHQHLKDHQHLKKKHQHLKKHEHLRNHRHSKKSDKTQQLHAADESDKEASVDTDLDAVRDVQQSSNEQKGPAEEDKMTPKQILDWAQAHSTSNEARQAVEEARAAVAEMQGQFQTTNSAAHTATHVHGNAQDLETTELVEDKPQVALLDEPELKHNSENHKVQKKHDTQGNLKVLVLSKEEEVHMSPSAILKWASKHAQSSMAKAAVAKARNVLSKLQTNVHAIKDADDMDD